MAQFTWSLSGHPCSVWVPDGEGPFPVLLLCAGDLSGHGQLARMACGHNPRILIAPAAVWEQDYTPWPAPSLPGRSPFTGRGPDFLREWKTGILPALAQRAPVSRQTGGCSAAGYSLGGLFALWALCSGGSFHAALSLSGSLWYEGWTDFLSAASPAPESRIFLSLGRQEEKRGSARMRSVGENTRQTEALLSKRLGSSSVTLLWQPGGHFTDVEKRWDAALSWLDQLP